MESQTNQSKVPKKKNSSEAQNKHNRISSEIENNRDHQRSNSFRLPPQLCKTFIATLLLFLTGMILIGFGFANAFWLKIPNLSISLWVLGGITFIPGSYYAFVFCRAYSSNANDREDLLEAIPEI